MLSKLHRAAHMAHGSDGREQDGLWPPRCSVDYGEQVRVAAGGPDQINVDVGETAVRNRYLCWL
jgi:hypothetical protein